MMEGWSGVIIGIMLGVGGAIMLFLIYNMIKMNNEFMVINKVREHEKDFHAKELKEREKKVD